MSEAPSDSPKDFPDVHVSVRTALLVLIALCLAYGVAFYLIASPAQLSLSQLLASLFLASTLLLLSYTDLRTGLLFDSLTLPLLIAGFLYSHYFGSSVWIALAGAIVGYALIAGLAAVWRELRGYEGIGLGDAKLLGACGAWVGLWGLPLVLLIASGGGLLVALTVSQKARSERGVSAIAFGPFIAAGAWIVWCRMNYLS